MSLEMTFKLDSAGVRAMLTGPEAQNAVNGAGRGLAARAGRGFISYPSTTSRARAYVHAGTRKAGIMQARKHVLERVYGTMGGG